MAWRENVDGLVRVEMGQFMKALVASDLATDAWNREEIWVGRSFAAKIWTLE